MLEKFDQNLPKNVILIEIKPGIKIYLVGVDEFSEDSEALVTYVIRKVKPKSVVLGICRACFDMLKLKNRALKASDITISKMKHIIDTYGAGNGLLYIASIKLRAFVFNRMGRVPGTEYQTAFIEASKLDCDICFGDRPIQITMNRVFAHLSILQKLQLYWNLSKFQKEQKNHKNINTLLEYMNIKFPNLSKIFIDERNICFSSALKQSVKSNIAKRKSKPISVVGIVSIDHISGLKTLMYDPKIPDLSELMTVPPPLFPTVLLGNLFIFSAITAGTVIIAKLIQ